VRALLFAPLWGEVGRVPGGGLWLCLWLGSRPLFCSVWSVWRWRVFWFRVRVRVRFFLLCLLCCCTVFVVCSVFWSWCWLAAADPLSAVGLVLVASVVLVGLWLFDSVQRMP